MSENFDETMDEVNALFGKLSGTEQQDYDILIVDDVRANIYLMEGILADNYTYLSVTSAQEMWEIIGKKPPRLVLLDLMMPYENGFQVLEKKKSNDLFKDIPVIVVSAKDSKDDVIKAMNLGAADYVAKPVTEEVLLKKIDRFLKN